MKKSLIAVTCIMAAAFAGVAGVLGFRLYKSSGVVTQAPDKANQQTDYGTSSFSYAEDDYETAQYPGYTQTTTQKSGLFGNLFSKEDESETSVTSSTLTQDTTGEKTTAQKISETVTTVTQTVTTVTQKVTSSSRTKEARNTAEFNKVFQMPKTPRYVPPESNIDFNTASLASYKYDPKGNYYYTDDKNAWQKGFGYTQIYDKMAGVAAMYYDTVRNKFTYDGKDWLIQFWKGQYGYYFVGSEIGIYTKKSGSSGAYACADKTDWMNMEMCFMWDENKTGDYKAIFTRPYDEYWWVTGFVVGFETAESLRSRKQFRVVGHITFDNSEMASLFCKAMSSNGFKEVSILLDPEQVDSYVRVGVDVGFVWQNINKK